MAWTFEAKAKAWTFETKTWPGPSRPRPGLEDYRKILLTKSAGRTLSL